MVERLTGKVEKITRIENVGQSLDLCEIQIDFDVLKIFYDYSELMDYLNFEVQYTVRKDVVKGVPDLVVCELAKLVNIQTVKSAENIRLIPEGTNRTVCNFDVTEARYGIFYPGIVAIASGYTIGSSMKARWFDITMVDKNSRLFEVRKFEPEGELEIVEARYKAIVGHYVTFDMESTKYGYQTKDITTLPQEVEMSPEVVVARAVLEEVIRADEGIAKYVRAHDMLNVLERHVDGEPGYALVRMASELYMINAIENISTDMDIPVMRRAVFCSRGYLLPHKTEWSTALLNNSKLMIVPELKADRELLLIIDPLAKEIASPTKAMYVKIRGLVNDIIDIRRRCHEKADSDIAALTRMFNGLL